MIIQQCDICKRYVPLYDSIVLHKKAIDYCLRCKAIADKMKEEYRKEYSQEVDNRLMNLEKRIIKRYIKK